MVGLFQGARENKKHVFSAICLGILFWFIQFAYQYYILVPGEMVSSIVRSTALTGATLIGIALFIGPLAKIFPARNYIQYRRTLGVLGFTFAILHVLSVMFFFFNFGVAEVLYSLNPYTNPLIFGVIAFLIYIPLYITSTDWALEKIGFKRWKVVHRFVYIAWILTVLHYVQINPNLLYNPVGYLLLIVTLLVFIFEIVAFVKYSCEKGGRGKYVGWLIIVFGIILFIFAYYLKQNILALSLIPITMLGSFILYIILKSRENKNKQLEIHKYDQIKIETV